MAGKPLTRFCSNILSGSGTSQELTVQAPLTVISCADPVRNDSLRRPDHVMTCAAHLLLLILIPCSLLLAAESVEQTRKEIVAAYQQSLDALRRGDADAAMQIDTKD